MNPVQYIILDPSLGMSTGKAAAQAAHASQLGLLLHVDNDTRESPYNKSIVNRWMQGGHYAKVVLQSTDLPTAERYLNDRGFKTALVIDEGRTEVDALTPTGIGTMVVDKDHGHTRATFGEFKLYADSVPSVPDELGKTWSFDQAGTITAPKDWLTKGAFRNAENLAAEAQPAFAVREYIRAAFRRVRERLGEAQLDEVKADKPVTITEDDVKAPDDRAHRDPSGARLNGGI